MKIVYEKRETLYGLNYTKYPHMITKSTYKDGRIIREDNHLGNIPEDTYFEVVVEFVTDKAARTLETELRESGWHVQVREVIE